MRGVMRMQRNSCVSQPKAHSGVMISTEAVTLAYSRTGGVRKRLAWCALASQYTLGRLGSPRGAEFSIDAWPPHSTMMSAMSMT